MKEQISIPSSKIQRAASFAGTGVKLGGNYIKYYIKKAVNPDMNRDELNEDNAEDIYSTLSKLKGSALKVAQMLSMDRNLLPTAYQNKFQMAQYSAPPLSYPLVLKTFKKELNSSPLDIFDEFTNSAVNAASIGQVHKATKDGKSYAVKVQYPGIADSVSSDLKIVKPIAVRLLNLKGNEVDKYFKEMEAKLLEETDYVLELKQSVEIAEACASIDGLLFPNYYSEWSSSKVLTMDWIEGQPLGEFVATCNDQVLRNKIGQSLWDFYMFQLFDLRKVHADPHPGNFIITNDGKLGVIDFGCVKETSLEFHMLYFRLLNEKTLENEVLMDESLNRLEYILPEDSEEVKVIMKQSIREMLSLLGQPFNQEKFDFSNDGFFKELYDLGEKFAQSPEIRKANGARGPKDALYINRTCFGLYSILNILKAEVNTTAARKYLNKLVD